MKICTKCKAKKVNAAFNADRRVPSGKQSACATCQVANTRRWRQNNPIKGMLDGARRRATKDGVPFNLTSENVIIPAVCPVLGIPLVKGENRGGNYNSPSLDRVIPDLGYVKENVTVISMKANRMKNDATPDELKKFAAWVGKTYGN